MMGVRQESVLIDQVLNTIHMGAKASKVVAVNAANGEVLE